MSDQERISRLEYALGVLIGWLYPNSLGANDLRDLYGILHQGKGVPEGFKADGVVGPKILSDRVRWEDTE